MENPISDCFDSRDLIEYKEYLDNELVDFYNDYIDSHNEICLDEDEEPQENIDTIYEVDFHLEGFRHRWLDHIEEYEEIAEFIDDLEGCSDFAYGTAIMTKFYFYNTYVEDFASDIGAVGDEAHWIVIDWDATADGLLMDYHEADFKNVEYVIRA